MTCFIKKAIGFTLAVFMLSFCFALPLNAKDPVVYLNFVKNAQPYYIVSDSGIVSGFEVQLSKAIFRDINYQMELTHRRYETMPQKMKDDLIFFGTKYFSYPGYVPSDLIYYRDYSFFSEESAQIKNLNANKLRDYHIGTLAKDHGEYRLSSMKDNLNVSLFSSAYDGIQALRNGEIDLWYGDVANIDYLMKLYTLSDEIHYHNEYVETEPVFIMIPEEHDDLLAQVNTDVAELKRSGEFEDIFQRFFLRHSYEYTQRQKNLIVARNSIILSMAGILLVVLFSRVIRRKLMSTKFSHTVSDSLINYGNRFVVLWKSDLSYYEVNDYFMNTFAVSQNIMPENLVEIFGEDKSVYLDENSKEMILKKISAESVVTSCCDRQGTMREIMWTSISISKHHGVHTVLSIGSDITEKNRLKKELQLSEERSHLAVESAGIALIFIDSSGQITQLSDVGRRLLGISAEDTVNYDALVGRLHPADRPNFKEIYESCLKDKNFSGDCEVRIFCRNERYHWFMFKFKSIHNPVDGIRAIAGAFYDIDKDKSKDLTIEKLAYIDELTGLYNRHKFLDSVAEVLKKSKGTGKRYAVVVLNLDKFHRFNDLHGVKAGDQVLKAVANVLKYNPYSDRESICSRLGSDEFAVLIELGVEEEHLERYIMEISMKIRNYTSWEYDDMKPTLSAGGCVYPDNADDYIQLYERSMYSMRIAKKSQSTIYQAYNKSIEEMILQKEIYETELQTAVEKKQFEVYYQPKMDINTEKIVGAEALIRWVHPLNGIVYPGEFIPLAEELGLISDIGRWTLRAACRQNKQWQDMGYKPIKISVNMSSVEFYHSDIVEQVRLILEETGLESKWLEIELTETMALTDLDETVRKMKALKKLGVGISMDDFGTGYSSFSHIKDLPIDEVKLDKSFIDQIAQDSTTQKVISVMIQMAKLIGLTVVAEGVEERIQLDLLKQMDCNVAQGYLFSQPLKAKDISAMFEEN